MTAAVWMGSPPEVHSALLSSGPGPGAMLAAASSWSSLSAEYDSVAAELTAVLADVQAGGWQGPSAEQYVSAHLPYLAWLTQASTASTAAAARHETVAGAYAGALAAMPTLAELAANHTTHAVLVGTNFFGINTVPIALNEADYVRMWIQAATTMATYEVTSDTAVAAAPPAAAAPQIEKSMTAGQHEHGSVTEGPTTDLIAHLLQNLGYQWNPAQGTLNGLGYDSYVNPGQPIYWVARALELFGEFQHFGAELLTNPAGAFQFLLQGELLDWPIHIAQIATWLAQTPQALAAVLVAPVGSLAGLGGLAGLAGLPQPVSPPALPAIPNPLDAWPAAGSVLAPAVAAAGSVVPAPATAPVAAPAVAAPALSPAVGVQAIGFPYLVGPPSAGFGSGAAARVGAAASAKQKSPTPDTTAAAAAAAARRQARTRRERRAKRRDHGDEFADMTVEVEPDWAAASDQGAGPLGLAGTRRKDTVTEVAGLATLPGDDFGAGPAMPMVPASWDGRR